MGSSLSRLEKRWKEQVVGLRRRVVYLHGYTMDLSTVQLHAVEL
jgi:hypothetical protein